MTLYRSPWPGDLHRHPITDAGMADLDPQVIDAAQRHVVRSCPDDFDTILDALGIG